MDVWTKVRGCGYSALRPAQRCSSGSAFAAAPAFAADIYVEGDITAADGERIGTGAVSGFDAGSTEDIASWVEDRIDDGWTPQILAFGIIVPTGEALVGSNASFTG